MARRRNPTPWKNLGLSVKDWVNADAALEILHRPVSWWVYRSSHKADIFQAYQDLTDEQRAGLRALNRAILGDGPVRLYRRATPGDELHKLSGASMTSDPDSYAGSGPHNLVPYDVDVDAILVHPRLPNFDALASKSYGHEHEYILHEDAKPRQVIPNPGVKSNPGWLSLDVTEAAGRAASRRGVSAQARGSGGFLRAFRAAGGRAGNLGTHKSGQSWKDRRDGFVARHTAQMKGSGWETVGGEDRPTRRHLALAVWAYSPTPGKLRRWLEKEGFLGRNQNRRNPAPKRSVRDLPILTVDDGPNGAAVLITGNGRRILGAWGWSWDPESKGGRALLSAAGSGDVLEFDTMRALGEHIAWRAAQLARGNFRLLSEGTWKGAHLQGGGQVEKALMDHAASQTFTRVNQRVWATQLLGLNRDEMKREGRVYRELQDLIRDPKLPKLPRRLQRHRHTWDAYGLALWATGHRKTRSGEK